LYDKAATPNKTLLIFSINQQLGVVIVQVYYCCNIELEFNNILQ